MIHAPGEDSMLELLCLCAALSLGQADEAAAAEGTPAVAPDRLESPAAAPAPDRWLLMKVWQGTYPGWLLNSRHTQVYGWLQQGFAANPAGPADRINFGSNLGWRSNDYRLNQLYFVSENAVELEGQPNLGHRVDFLVGNDAPFLVANGLFSDFTGFDETSGLGVDGPQSFRQANRIGIDLPQFYLEAAVPRLLTDRGIEIRAGKFYTLMGREVYPAADTDFYSRTYENIYATPYTHTGFLATVHATRTLDVVAGVVEGWDVFEDNNQSPSFHGAFIWNSPQQRYNWTTGWITGPEQPNNNHDYRTLVSSYLTCRFGSQSEWLFVTGGHYAAEANAAVDPVTGSRHQAQWYACAGDLFYTVNARTRLGMRAEWFRDNDGTRTALLKRPGFVANFYDLTLGVTYKPQRSLTIRPEVRWDWSDGHAIDGSAAQPYNDLRDAFQFTAAVDMIWRY